MCGDQSAHVRMLRGTVSNGSGEYPVRETNRYARSARMRPSRAPHEMSESDYQVFYPRHKAVNERLVLDLR